MNNHNLDHWLFDQSGPAIRYRTTTELFHLLENDDLRQLEADLLASEMVQTWLERLQPDFSFNALHGSKPTCYENVMGKLTQLGCRSGMQLLDERVTPFLHWLETARDRFEDHAYGEPIVAAFLMRADYGHEPPVTAVAQRRLDILYDFCRNGRYDIFVDPAGYPAIPRAFRRHGLVDPALYEEGYMQLPDLYDLYLLGSLPDNMMDEVTAHKLDTIINYIMQPEYQRLPDGYGIALLGKRRYWAIGWSVHLPGYFGFDSDAPEMRRLVRMTILMAQFPAARRHPWFKEAYAHLDVYCTQTGTHRFLTPYLREGQRGYWIMGTYMGLEENRRKKTALELESTFWMRKLASLCED